MGWTRQEVLDVARSTGQPVVEAWSDHNAGSMGTVVGPMLHHTGSAWSYPTNKAPTLRVVREGRPGLENSLSMYYIDYEGVIYCISEKLSWHSGAGAWSGVTDGNGHFAGIEAESDGKQWTKATVSSYKKLAAAILRKTGRTVAYAPRHADYALPKGRKTDFSGIDPATFLSDVNAELGHPTTGTSGDFLMALTDDQQIALATAVGRIEYALMNLVKPSTDYIPNMANAVSELHWGVLDEQQGLRVAVSGLYAKLAGGSQITAADIAAAIPDGIAADVADELQRRLAA